MVITDAKYHALDGNKDLPNVSITCTIDGKSCSVPIAKDNTEYIEIQRQVAAGELTIADAD